MEGHAEKSVERYWELAKKDVSSLQQVATQCIDDHQIPPEDYAQPERSLRYVLKLTEKLVPGKKWTTRVFLVSKYSGTI